MVPILIVVRVGLGLANDGTTTKNKDVVNLTTFHATTPAEKNASVTYGGSDVAAPKEVTDDHGSHSSLHATRNDNSSAV
jgi:hypothetical protein